MDAGQPIEVHGEQLGGGSTGQEEPKNALVDEEWTTFRERVDREWRLRRASSNDVDLAGPPPPGYEQQHYGLTDFGDRLLSGPAAELFGDSTPPGGFSAFGARSPGPASHPSLPEIHPSNPGMYPVADAASAALPPPSTETSVPSAMVPAPAETSGLVRPYFRTRGRTRPAYDLAIEALVSTSERGRSLDHVRQPEHRSICGLCLDTRSVAEVAAYLRLPLGVVRVLIGDVAGLGLVLVHSAASVVGDRPSIDFMERVLSGLRRI